MVSGVSDCQDLIQLHHLLNVHDGRQFSAVVDAALAARKLLIQNLKRRA